MGTTGTHQARTDLDVFYEKDEEHELSVSFMTLAAGPL